MLGGIDLNAERPADLFDRHSFEMAEHERCTLIPAEAIERGDDVLLQLRAQEQAIGLRIGGLEFADHLAILTVVDAMLFVTSAGAEEIERAVDRDSVHPCAEVRALLEPVDLSIRPKKCLLHHIVGIVFVPGHAIRHSEDGPTVPLDESSEGIRIAASGPAHGREIGQFHLGQVRLGNS